MGTWFSQIMQMQWLGRSLAHWLRLVVGLLGVLVLAILLYLGLRLLIHKVFKRFGRSVHQLERPLKQSIRCLAYAISAHLIREAVRSNHHMDAVLDHFCRSFYVLAISVALATLLPAFVNLLGRQSAKRQNDAYHSTVGHYFAIIIRCIICLFAILAILAIWGVNISGLLAGVGIGGLALSLAAKDTLSNLIGGMTIILDRPFAIGDYIQLESNEGTVEAIGFRSTKLRTSETSLIILPNNKVVSEAVVNISRLQLRRISILWSIHAQTPSEKISALLEKIRHAFKPEDRLQLSLEGLDGAKLTILMRFYRSNTQYDDGLNCKTQWMIQLKAWCEALEIETQALPFAVDLNLSPCGPVE